MKTQHLSLSLSRSKIRSHTHVLTHTNTFCDREEQERQRKLEAEERRQDREAYMQAFRHMLETFIPGQRMTAAQVGQAYRYIYI